MYLYYLANFSPGPITNWWQNAHVSMYVNTYFIISSITF